MGESRGGEGRAGGPTTVQVARYVAQELEKDEREPEVIHVARVTEGLYALSLAIRGEPEPERYFLAVADMPPPEAPSSPSGGSSPSGNGGI